MLFSNPTVNLERPTRMLTSPVIGLCLSLLYGIFEKLQTPGDGSGNITIYSNMNISFGDSPTVKLVNGSIFLEPIRDTDTKTENRIRQALPFTKVARGRNPYYHSIGQDGTSLEAIIYTLASTAIYPRAVEIINARLDRN